MSLTGSLSNALSGLGAASRAAELVSANVANAGTPGYARRDLSLSALAYGGASGVRVDGVTRAADPTLIADMRLAMADRGDASARAEAYGRLESLFGIPGEPGALTDRLAAFEARLSEVAAQPGSNIRLDAAARAAGDLATGINGISEGIQTLRGQADRDIDEMVGTINTTLEGVADLNIQIRRAKAAGRDTSGLEDNRQRMIDQIASLVPLREASRPGGAVALYSTGGAVLLDGSAARLEFTATRQVTPYMTLRNGQLSGLAVRGVTLDPGSGGPLSGGALSAAFGLRDTIAPEVQAGLDAFARDLVSRFSAPGLDPTRAPSDPGLFTDAGAAFDPANETGLASRLSLNAAVDPDAGGASWRLRDGLAATAPGLSGDGSLLLALGDAMTEPLSVASGGFGPGRYTAAGLASGLVSDLGTAHQRADSRLAFAIGSADQLEQAYLGAGVDTDQEMQKLLLVEKLYNANARVVAAIDEMLDTLVRL